jgi:hypothetical protein
VKGFAVPIAALLGLLAWECLPATADTATVPAPVAAAVTATAATVPPVAAWADAALARPLFNRDRRPTPGAPGAHDGLPRLAGTIRSDESILAIFATPGAGPDTPSKSVVVHATDTVAGWTVADIADGAVTLERGSRSALVRVSFTDAPAPTPAGPAKLTLLHDKRTSSFLQP